MRHISLCQCEVITRPSRDRGGKSVSVICLIDRGLAVDRQLICRGHCGKTIDSYVRRCGYLRNLILAIVRVSARDIVAAEEAVETSTVNKDIRGAFDQECLCRLQ